MMADDEEHYVNDENDPTHVTKVETKKTILQDDERVEDDERVGGPKLTITNLEEHDAERTNMLIRTIKEGKLR